MTPELSRAARAWPRCISPNVLQRLDSSFNSAAARTALLFAVQPLFDFWRMHNEKLVPQIDQLSGIRRLPRKDPRLVPGIY